MADQQRKFYDQGVPRTKLISLGFHYQSHNQNFGTQLFRFPWSQ